MRRYAWMPLLSMLLAASVPCGAGQTIRFAPLPMQNREAVVKQFRPLTDCLESMLGATIVYVHSDSYAVILDRFRRSEVDLAYLGPLPYVELRSAFPHAEPLVHFKENSGRADYTCALVTIPDAVFDIYDAKDRKIALTQPLSTCGFLSVNGLMRRSGSDLNRNRYRYLGKHDEVALAVLRGEFDAGGVKTAIARHYTHLGLQILKETAPLPAFAMVGNALTLPPALMDRLRRGLVAMEPEGKDRSRMGAWGENLRHGAVSASDADYREVRELMSGARIPEKGNF